MPSPAKHLNDKTLPNQTLPDLARLAELDQSAEQTQALATATLQALAGELRAVVATVDQMSERVRAVVTAQLADADSRYFTKGVNVDLADLDALARSERAAQRSLAYRTTQLKDALAETPPAKKTFLLSDRSAPAAISRALDSYRVRASNPSTLNPFSEELEVLRGRLESRRIGSALLRNATRALVSHAVPNTSYVSFYRQGRVAGQVVTPLSRQNGTALAVTEINNVKGLFYWHSMMECLDVPANPTPSFQASFDAETARTTAELSRVAAQLTKRIADRKPRFAVKTTTHLASAGRAVFSEYVKGQREVAGLDAVRPALIAIEVPALQLRTTAVRHNTLRAARNFSQQAWQDNVLASEDLGPIAAVIANGQKDPSTVLSAEESAVAITSFAASCRARLQMVERQMNFTEVGRSVPSSNSGATVISI